LIVSDRFDAQAVELKRHQRDALSVVASWSADDN